MKSWKGGKFEYFLYILVSLFILLSSFSIYYLYNKKVIIAFGVCAILFSFFYVFYKIKLEKKKIIFPFSAIVILASVCLLVLCWKGISAYGIYVTIVFLLLVLLIHLVNTLGDLHLLVNVFVLTVVCGACISLLFWFFGSIVHLINPSGTIDLFWGTEQTVNNYYGLYFEPQYSDTFIGRFHLTCRNSFIYPEAPVCCFMLISANLLNNLFIKNKTSNLILLIAILSTLTVTGFLYVMALVLSSSINSKTKSHLKVFAQIISFILILFCVLFFASSLLSAKMESGSGVDRAAHMMSELNAFRKSPIYGFGFNTFTDGSSNSITALLADGGILLFMLYYCPLFFSIFKMKNKDDKIICLAFIFVFMITVVHYLPVSVFLICCLCMHSNCKQVF